MLGAGNESQIHYFGYLYKHKESVCILKKGETGWKGCLCDYTPFPLTLSRKVEYFFTINKESVLKIENPLSRGKYFDKDRQRQ